MNVEALPVGGRCPSCALAVGDGAVDEGAQQFKPYLDGKAWRLVMRSAVLCNSWMEVSIPAPSCSVPTGVSLHSSSSHLFHVTCDPRQGSASTCQPVVWGGRAPLPVGLHTVLVDLCQPQ